MDPKSTGLEFFDFKNISEEERNEIQALLKESIYNGCVELPWKTQFQIDYKNSTFAKGGSNNSKTVVLEEEKEQISITQPTSFTVPQNLITPVAAGLSQPVTETFVTIPTTVGYHNAPYFVSRTLPYLRAYPHLGVPFFACSIPGTGETASIPNPYSQFVPIVPVTAGQEKVESDSHHKKPERSINRHNKKKISDCHSENPTDLCKDVVVEKSSTISEAASSTVNDCQTAVPLVPLSPSTFAVAGGTLPLHGYPPGLHTLPYTQVPSPQAPSAAMYYVPVFNHPYGSYIPSPTSAAVVLPVNLRHETEIASTSAESSSSNVPKNCAMSENLQKGSLPKQSCDLQTTPAVQEDLHVKEQCDDDHGVAKSQLTHIVKSSHRNSMPVKNSPCEVQSNCSGESFPEESNTDQLAQVKVGSAFITKTMPMVTTVEEHPTKDYHSNSASLSHEESVDQQSLTTSNTTAKISDKETVCNVSPAATPHFTTENSSVVSSINEANGDMSRSWADLFRSPCIEVNGIENQRPSKQTGCAKRDIANGKVYSVSVRDSTY